MADDVVSCVLKEAANYIEEHGWVQRSLEEDGAVCMIGAISSVVFESPFPERDYRAKRHEVYRRAIARLASLLPTYVAEPLCSCEVCQRGSVRQRRAIEYFNDTPGRTKETVVSVLRHASDLDTPQEAS